jgi:aminomethyltransferase
MKKSRFFDFFNRRDNVDFNSLMANGIEDEDYINWNEFLLPQDYGDAEAEYHAIRNSCAIFDVSPIRKIAVRGAGAGTFLDRLLTRPVSTLPVMRATYTVLCTEAGEFKDDAILYKYADDDYLIMPSDIDHSPYFEDLCVTYGLTDVSFTECTDALVGVAVQGPLSAAVLHQIGFTRVDQLRPFEVRDFEFYGGTMRISRVGFTADLGYECWLKPSLADALTTSIQAAREQLNLALPGYGLAALEACRLEGGFIVAGWDCSTELDPVLGFERSPYELGLGWLVNLDAVDFVGRDALQQQQKDGCRYTLRSMTIDSASKPEQGTILYLGPDESSTVVGMVNCASWSWGLGKMIGNASIESEYGEHDTAWIILDGEPQKVRLCSGPLVNLKRRNQLPAPLH